MPCDSKPVRKGQTLAQRAQEVRAAGQRIDQLIAARKVQIKVGTQGAVVFIGLTDEQRDGMTDACIVRRLMQSGSATSRMMLQQAEKLAGRSVDKRVIAQGTHSHDGGVTWSPRG